MTSIASASAKIITLYFEIQFHKIYASGKDEVRGEDRQNSMELSSLAAPSPPIYFQNLNIRTEDNILLE